MRALVLPCAVALTLAGASAYAGGAADLKQLSLEELLQVQVVSVSKRSEKLLEAPASIFVITADDIRRSGATSLAEALRLAPGLLIARQDAVQYAISARGFNNAIGNKLLVMIDGRTIYTPLFSGVFWDDQALPVQDIERVEVITGPGATLWGANAVNGVINVITRAAADARGSAVSVDAGENEAGVYARQGLPLGANGALRLSGSYRDWDASRRESGAAAGDRWYRRFAGFRADWSAGGDTLTLQGDVHDGASQRRAVVGAFDPGRVEASGGNVLARWERELAAGSQLRLQAYYDHTSRSDLLYFRPRSDLYDIELQHLLSTGRHTVVWGAGHREASDDAMAGVVILFLPQKRNLSWSNVFLQDEIALGTRWRVTPGLKLERNDYTGWEYLPSVRVAFESTPRQSWWMSASRAVRAPARIDRDLYFPASPPYVIAGGPDFHSEVAQVLELGYRTSQGARFAFSVTAFVHFWDDLRSGTPVPVQLQNNIEGEVGGIETWAVFQATQRWKLQAGVTWLHESIHPDASHPDALGATDPNLRNDPDYQWSARSSLDLPGRWSFDLQLRRVGALPNPSVDAYTEADVRFAWRPHDTLELAVGARDLLHAAHIEYGAAPARVEIGRNLYGSLTWQR